MGQVLVPLRELSEETMTLKNAAGTDVSGSSGKKATITLSLAWKDMPSDSRIKGVWRVTIHKAENLPICDMRTSDPFVTVYAWGQDNRFTCRESSSIIITDLNPVWNETFELPISRGLPTALKTLLDGLREGPD